MAAELPRVPVDTEIAGGTGLSELTLHAVAALSLGFGLVEVWVACFC